MHPQFSSTWRFAHLVQLSSISRDNRSIIFNKSLFISLRLRLYNSPPNQTLRRAFDICGKTSRTSRSFIRFIYFVRERYNLLDTRDKTRLVWCKKRLIFVKYFNKALKMRRSNSLPQIRNK